MILKTGSKLPPRKNVINRRSATRRSRVARVEEITTRTPLQSPIAPDRVEHSAPERPSAPGSSTRPRPSSKLGIVLSMLEAPEGVPLSKLVEVTGWLPHTTRAALTGLRKRGFTIVSEKTNAGGSSVYRIRADATSPAARRDEIAPPRARSEVKWSANTAEPPPTSDRQGRRPNRPIQGAFTPNNAING